MSVRAVSRSPPEKVESYPRYFMCNLYHLLGYSIEPKIAPAVFQQAYRLQPSLVTMCKGACVWISVCVESKCATVATHSLAVQPSTQCLDKSMLCAYVPVIASILALFCVTAQTFVPVDATTGLLTSWRAAHLGKKQVSTKQHCHQHPPTLVNEYFLPRILHNPHYYQTKEKDMKTLTSGL